MTIIYSTKYNERWWLGGNEPKKGILLGGQKNDISLHSLHHVISSSYVNKPIRYPKKCIYDQHIKLCSLTSIGCNIFKVFNSKYNVQYLLNNMSSPQIYPQHQFN
jgi:hypothetical protein